MDSVYCIVSQTVRLSDPTKKTQLQTPLAYNNNLAHSMRVIVLEDDGTDADLTGVSVIGNMLRADGNTVFPITGTVTGNVAEVELPVSCYVVPGRFKFTLDLTIPRSTSGIDSFSTSTAYVKGDLVKRNGVVYRFVNDHAAGAWNDADVVADRHTRTAMWVEGYVERNISENIVDPGTPPGNIQSIITQAENAATAATTAAGQASTAATQADTARQGLQQVAFLGSNGVTAITSSGNPDNPTNLDSFNSPGVYTATNGVASGLANCPTSVHFRMYVFYGSSSTNYVQVLIDRTNNRIHVRTGSGSSWSEWVSLIRSSDVANYFKAYGASIDANNYSTRLPDLNSAELNKAYFINLALADGKIANKPTDLVGTNGILLTFAGSIASSQSALQTLTMTNGDFWLRVQYLGTWGEWRCLNNDLYDNERYYLSTCVDKTKTHLSGGDSFVVIGDSIANMGADGQNGWPDLLAQATGATAVRSAKAGIGFLHAVGGVTISTKVDDVSDWSGKTVCFVAAGVNDAGNFAVDEMTYSGFKTEVGNVITKIKTAAPNIHIVFITPIRVGGTRTHINRLTTIAGIIGHVALINGCSVINGFDFPIPVTNVEPYDDNGTTRYIIDDQTENNDHIHPSIAVGMPIYAKAVINAIY